MMKYLMILCFITQSLFAQDATVLKKGDPAPFDGVIFTKEKEKEIRLMTETKKLQDEKIDLYDKRIALRDKQLDSLAERVVEQKDESLFTKVGMFILGAAVTTGVAFGVSRIAK